MKITSPISPLSKHKGSDLFWLYIVNYVLTVCTLGVYSAWAKAKVYDFFWTGTELDGYRFRFLGNGLEILKGLLIGLGVLALVSVLYNITFLFVSDPNLAGLLSLSYSAGILVLYQFAYFTSRRYRFHRTSYREIRFRLKGTSKEFIKEVLPYAIGSTFTLGLVYPLFVHKRFEYIYNHLYFGSLPFRLNGKSDTFWKMCLKGFFFTLFTFGVYQFWFISHLHHYFCNHMSLGTRDENALEDATIQFASTATPKKVFHLKIGNFFLLLCTLGIAYPWAQIRTTRFYLENIQLLNLDNLDHVLQTAVPRDSSLGEGIGDAMDMDIDLSF
jgi:uncharacterized membrane protein YjgN (DUF898 family)